MIALIIAATLAGLYADNLTQVGVSVLYIFVGLLIDFIIETMRD